MKVLVASKNKTKIEGTYNSLKKYYKDIEIEGISVESNVSDQPFNKETFDGAKNRIEELLKYSKEYDLYISLESGLIEEYGNYFISTVCLISDNEGNMSYGISPSYPLPEKYVEKVLKENLNAISKEVFEKSNAGATTGTIHFLTKENYNRHMINEIAVDMALTSHLNKDVWM